jgi:hypothetical protein
MVCSVCKKNFIRSVDLTEYYKNKEEFDNTITKIIDSLTEEELAKRNDEIWDELLNFEALLLHPNFKPKKCSAETCNSLICKYCYDCKSKTCLECKNPPPTVNYD